MRLHPDDKLIRDNIPDLAAARGNPMDSVRVATEAELPLLVTRKLCEEAMEFYREPVIEELGDVAEVILLATSVYGFSLQRIREAHQEWQGDITHLSVALVGAASIFNRIPRIEHFSNAVEIFDELCKRVTLFDPVLVEQQRLQKRAEKGAFDRHLVWRKPPPPASSPVST